MRNLQLFFTLILPFFIIGFVRAQIFPVDTVINFSTLPLVVEPVPNATRYIFSVEQLGTTTTFEKESNCNLVSLRGLSWDQSYRWKCAAYDTAGTLLGSSAHARFLIKGNSRTDGSEHRLRIIDHEGSHGEDLIFLDHASTAMDREGNAVWFLPENPLWSGQWERLRDIRLTEQGTVTFIHEGKGIFETDLAGNVLWMVDSPIKDTAMEKRYFHHEFFRRGDHYFVLAMESVEKQFKGDTAVQTVPYDQVLEYDRSGKVVWKWDAQDYFVDAEFIALRGERKKTPGQGHMNSLSISEDGKYLYGGFRNISRVVKIKKKNGKVVRSYGQKILKGRAHVGHHWFRRQHNATILPGHRVLVFNNDSVMDPAISSSIVIFDERAKKDTDGLLWEFDLRFDTLSDAKCTQTGSVELLPNGNILAGLGTVNRIIEVTMDKKVVWDAFILRKSLMVPGAWDPFPQYRIHSSPDLWPVLFGLGIRAGEQVWLDIQNEGRVADRYAVDIRPRQGPPQTFLTGEVAPGNNITHQLPFDELSGATITVRSTQNPGMSQTFSYPARP